MLSEIHSAAKEKEREREGAPLFLHFHAVTLECLMSNEVVLGTTFLAAASCLLSLHLRAKTPVEL